MAIKNPFTNPDGSPIEGKEFEFIEFELKKDKERIDELPEKEKRKELVAQEILADRMQS